MPRNKSEKLPSCPAAHVYADACEAVLKGERASLAGHVWLGIPSKVVTAIDRSAQVGALNWRQRRIKFIRETYGP